MPAKYTPKQRLEAFWQKVDKNGPLWNGTPCWLWTGCKDRATGYGQFVIEARHKAKPHRFAYAAIIGPIAPGLDLDHLCRVRHCCNPEHLEPTTRAENLRRGLNGILKTHCPKGHPYNEANTGGQGSKHNGRYCRICLRLRVSAWRAARKLEQLETSSF